MTTSTKFVDCACCRFLEYEDALVTNTKTSLLKRLCGKGFYRYIVASASAPSLLSVCWEYGPRSWELPLEELELEFYG